MPLVWATVWAIGESSPEYCPDRPWYTLVPADGSPITVRINGPTAPAWRWCSWRPAHVVGCDQRLRRRMDANGEARLAAGFWDAATLRSKPRFREVDAYQPPKVDAGDRRLHGPPARSRIFMVSGANQSWSWWVYMDPASLEGTLCRWAMQGLGDWWRSTRTAALGLDQIPAMMFPST